MWRLFLSLSLLFFLFSQAYSFKAEAKMEKQQASHQEHLKGEKFILHPEGRRSPKFDERLKRAGELMKEEGLDALLLTKPANMFYLTGDGRLCAYALITRAGKVALGVPATDMKDVLALAYFDEMAGFEDEVGMLHSIHNFFEKLGLAKAKVGFENTFLTVSMKSMLTHPHALPETAVAADGTEVMSRARMVKSREEVEMIKWAAKVADEGLRAAVEAVRPGATEIDIAGAAEAAMRKAEAEGFYRTYVASGPRTNIAHGLPSYRKVEKGDLVTIDLHPVYHGYCADACRTVCAGNPTAKQKEAFDLFLKAQQKAIGLAKAGAKMLELEEALHSAIREAGLGEHVFGPPLHGVGLEFEEPPLPSGHAFFHGEKEAAPLGEGVVVSIGNCGLYLGDFGVRVEDTVLVTKKGPVVLTSFRRGLY
jgi:Xaa-Pro aminopeptidase